MTRCWFLPLPVSNGALGEAFGDISTQILNPDFRLQAAFPGGGVELQAAWHLTERKDFPEQILLKVLKPLHDNICLLYFWKKKSNLERALHSRLKSFSFIFKQQQ